MITKEKTLNNDYIKELFEKKQNLLEYTFDQQIPNIEDVTSDETVRANFWYDIAFSLYNHYRKREQRTKSYYNIDFSKLASFYDVGFMEYILLSTDKYIDLEFRRQLVKIEPYLALIEALQCTPWQAFVDNGTSATEISKIYYKLKDLPTPFADERFKAYPIHTEAYQRGLNISEWLKSKKGGWNKYYDEEKGETVHYKAKSAYKNIMLDAKIGIIIYFKDLPSMTISFQFDSEKNLYIHQIQCQKKDRGHYKIKGDWKIAALNYLKSIFPDYTMHLIEGKVLADIVEKGYRDDSPEDFKPSIETFIKIGRMYNNILPDFSDYYKKGSFTYRNIDNALSC